MIPDVIDGSLAAAWERDGWLHLPGFLSPSDTARVNEEIERLWQTRPPHVTVDDLDRGQRLRMSEIAVEQRSHRVKINDLYLTSEVVRKVLLDPALVALVGRLMGDVPVLCNSLNLERSSAQDYHADSLYMSPLTPGSLGACWIALEDVRPGAGPLRLYPGSQRIPRFVFSNGMQHAVPSEMPRWNAHVERYIHELALQPYVVHARAGDLVLWHADLLHGAEEIRTEGATRRSLVAHYYARRDCRRLGYTVAREGDALWLKRRPQPVDFTSRALCAIERRVWRLRAVADRLIGGTGSG